MKARNNTYIYTTYIIAIWHKRYFYKSNEHYSIKRLSRNIYAALLLKSCLLQSVTKDILSWDNKKTLHQIHLVVWNPTWLKVKQFLTCSLVVRPRATRTMWNPVSPTTGIQRSPTMTIRHILNRPYNKNHGFKCFHEN